jgi:hypothetical protein
MSNKAATILRRALLYGTLPYPTPHLTPSLTSPSPLLLPQIPREIPLFHCRHHILRPRRLCHTTTKAHCKEEYPLLPLSTPPTTRH